MTNPIRFLLTFASDRMSKSGMKRSKDEPSLVLGPEA
jgi:hypothetical protein